MQIRCAWCGVDLGVNEPLSDPRDTYGICAGCVADEWSGDVKLRLGEYLDQFDEPVMVLDEEVRIFAINRAMAERIGSDPRRSHGLLGGEANLCRYATLPEGCGNTVHCRDCSIRIAVEVALRDRCSTPPTPALLFFGDEEVSLFLSSRYVRGRERGPLVAVRLHLPDSSSAEGSGSEACGNQSAD